jgi:hypothetical protein
MKIFFRKFTKIKLFFLLITLSSCAKNIASVNDMFVKKYGQKVKEINQERVLPKNIANEIVSSVPPTKEEISDYIASQEKYQGYVPIYHVGEYVPKQYFPNRATMDEMSRNNPANNVPPDIFEVRYNNFNNPPFSNSGAEFDMVMVPSQDAYGNRSIATEKKYLLIANNEIQNAVTKINQKRSDDDFEFSKILVKEKKQQIKQRKNEQIFGASQFGDIALIDNYNIEDVQKEDDDIKKNNKQPKQTKTNN